MVSSTATGFEEEGGGSSLPSPRTGFDPILEEANAPFQELPAQKIQLLFQKLVHCEKNLQHLEH